MENLGGHRLFLGEYHRHIWVCFFFVERAVTTVNWPNRFTATVPSIVEDLGYSSANAQLMTIPIYLFAVICVLVVACKYPVSEAHGISQVVYDLSSNFIQGCPNGPDNEHHSSWL